MYLGSRQHQGPDGDVVSEEESSEVLEAVKPATNQAGTQPSGFDDSSGEQASAFSIMQNTGKTRLPNKPNQKAQSVNTCQSTASTWGLLVPLRFRGACYTCRNLSLLK